MLKKSSLPQIGFVGFGEVNTPREFIDDRCHQAAEELRKRGLAVVETAPVSGDPDGLQAQRAIDELAQADFDALVLCEAGWIPSWAVMKIAEQFRHQAGDKLRKLLRITHYQPSGHIRAARGHLQMIATLAVELVRAMRVAQHHDGAVFHPVVPYE